MTNSSPSTPASNPAQATSVYSNWWEWLGVAVIGSYYLTKLLYFALNIAPGIPPDETTHLGLIRLYAQTPLFIEDSSPSHPLGLVTNVPYLYHLLLGKLLTLNFFGIEDYRFLRLTNIGLSLLTFGTCYGLAKETSKNLWARLLFLVMITNTMMFTFISSAISYDNLVNLLAVFGVWMLVRFLRTSEPVALLACLAALGLGSLTKTSFLPLVPATALVLLWQRRRYLRTDLASVFETLKTRRPVVLLLTLVIIMSSLGSLLLYGGNLVRYQKPVPTCDEVLNVDQCMQNRIFARGRILELYRDGEIGYEQAVGQTGRIAQAGDRNHALRLLDNERRYKSSPTPPLNRFSYLLLVWDRALKPTMFGIQAHLSMLKSPNETVAYEIILIVALLVTIRKIRGSDREWTALAAISAAYVLFLVCFYNYSTYVQTHAPFLGVQGRYLFPVLAPVFLIASEFVLRPFRGKWKIIVAAVIAAIFLAGELPYFRSHASPAWFSGPGTAAQMDRGSANVIVGSQS